MGFLSKFAKKLGNAIGVGIEKIGQVVHSDAIQNAGISLQCACDFGDTSWNENSSVSRTVDVHKELNKVTESIVPSAATSENKLIDICISEVGEILSNFIALTPCLELTRLNENFNSEIHAKLSGQLMNYIQPRLSLDDKECKRILEIHNDVERKKEAEKFREQVLADAEFKFKAQCIKVKKDYCKKMLDIANSSLISIQEEMQKQNELLQQMLMQVTDEQTIDSEREQALITIEKLSILSAIAFDR